jgi:hypothetical protein
VADFEALFQCLQGEKLRKGVTTLLRILASGLRFEPGTPSPPPEYDHYELR